MNKLNFLLSILFSINTFCLPPISYMMRLHCDGNLKCPKFSGYYKGQKIKFDGGFFNFKDTNKSATFVLVVTSQITKKRSNYNTISLERVLNNACKIYYFTQKEDIWLIEEEREEDMPLRLPDTAFILLLDPKYIDKIDTSIISNSDSLIYLPRMYLNGMSDLSKELDIIALDALDIDCVHNSISNVNIANNTALISLPENI